MGKKYFLQDEEIRNVGEDYFRHDDLAANIRHILKENSAPYNIAVIGKWGLGKSSLINLAKKEFENDDAYLFVTINAWKYEKESLSKVFLRQVMEQLESDNDKETQRDKTKKSISEIFKGLLKKSSKEKAPNMFKVIWDFLRKYPSWVLGYIAISFFLYGVYRAIVVANTDQPVWVHYPLDVLSGYMSNSVKLVIVPAVVFILTKIGFDFEKNPLSKVDFQLPEMNVEDYEIELGRAINKKHKNIKIVIIVDDLDRLSAEKMVEALDAIKMFINYSNCIFIVPFDESIIKKAISDCRLKDDSGDSAKLLESEQFLDKLFQYKIHLSPLLAYDIREYAKKLCDDNLKDFYMEYCPQESFTEVLKRVIIYPGVTTPRQVKKLVNTFISYMMIANSREKNGKLRKGFSTEMEGICTIAKLSVLQADFKDFYDLLFEDDAAIDKVLHYYEHFSMDEGESEENVLNDSIRDVLDISESEEIPKSALPLVNFLIYTRNIGRGDILPYLYVAEDDIVRQTGNQAHKEFIKAATSGNIVESRKALENNQKLVLSAKEFIDSGNDRITLLNMVRVMMAIEDVVNDEGKIIIADVLSDRAIDIGTYWSDNDEELANIDTAGLFGYYNYAKNKEKYSYLLDTILENDPIKETASEIVRNYLDNKEYLNKKTLTCLDEYIFKAIEKNALEFGNFKDIRCEFKLNEGGWMHIYYECIIQHIAEVDDYSNGTLQELRDVYHILINNDNSSVFEELEPLFDKAEMTRTFVMLLDCDDPSEVSDELIRNMIIRQIVASGEVSSINELLANNRCEYSKDEYETIDEYMLSQVAEEIMPQILAAYLESNAIDNIPQTVNTVISQGFSDRTKSAIKCIELIIETKSATANKNIENELSKACAYNVVTNYDNMAELLDNYAKINPEFVIKMLLPNITLPKETKLSDDFITFLTDFMVREKNNEAFEDVIHKFVQNLLTRLKSQNQNVDIIVRTLNLLDEFLKVEDFAKVQPVIHKNINEVNIQDVYHLYNKKYDAFGNDEGKLKLSNHVEVCIGMIENQKEVTEAIKILNSKYTRISEIERFAHAINQDDVDRKLAFDTLTKFIDKGFEGEKQISNVKSICRILDNEGIEFFNEVYKDRKDIRDAVSSVLVEQEDEFTFDEIAIVLEWILSRTIPRGEEFGVSDVLSLLVSMVNSKENSETVIGLIEKVSTGQFNKKKDKYISMYVELLRRNYDEELNETIIAQAKSRGNAIVKKVIEAAPDSMNKELTGYLSGKK